MEQKNRSHIQAYLPCQTGDGRRMFTPLGHSRQDRKWSHGQSGASAPPVIINTTTTSSSSPSFPMPESPKYNDLLGERRGHLVRSQRPRHYENLQQIPWNEGAEASACSYVFHQYISLPPSARPGTPTHPFIHPFPNPTFVLRSFFFCRRIISNMNQSKCT